MRFLVVVAVLFFGGTSYAPPAKPPGRQLAQEDGPDAAKVIVKVLSEKAIAAMSGKFTSEVRSAEFTADKSKHCLALSKTVEVVTDVKSDGTPTNVKSEVYLTVKVKVEVVALYPL